jgi:hypothetical protein
MTITVSRGLPAEAENVPLACSPCHSRAISEGQITVPSGQQKDEVPGSSPGLRAAPTRAHRGTDLKPARARSHAAPDEGYAPQPSERQIPILPGLMQGPMPAGLTLVIELVLDSPTARAPKPGKHSSDPAEHGRRPLLCLPRTVLLARRKHKTAGGPGALGEGRGRSALGPYRIGNLPDTGGHQRSRRVRRNRRPQHLPAHDLGRPSSVEAGSNPTSSAFP